MRPRTKEVEVNGHAVTVKWNDTCNFYQPVRAHHCSVNNDCVDKFDHHCPWVGTTIGRRNYRTYLAFVFSATALCIFVVAASGVQIKLKKDELGKNAAAQGGEGGEGDTLEAMRECPGALVVMSVAFIFFWFVGALAAFHTYLISTNQTTYEHFRRNLYDPRPPNPYDVGLLGNCAEACCWRTPPSKVDFRARWSDAHAELERAAEEARLARAGVTRDACEVELAERGQAGGGRLQTGTKQQPASGGAPVVRA